MFWHTAAITQDNVADGFVKEVSKRICSGAMFGSRRLFIECAESVEVLLVGFGGMESVGWLIALTLLASNLSAIPRHSDILSALFDPAQPIELYCYVPAQVALAIPLLNIRTCTIL